MSDMSDMIDAFAFAFDAYELQLYICSFIPPYILAQLSKKHHATYHCGIVKHMVEKNTSHRFMAYCIRQDNAFILRAWLLDKKKDWTLPINYYYKEHQYENYVHVLEELCYEHNAVACMAEIYALDYLDLWRDVP